MKYNRVIKTSCLTGLITLSLTAFSFAAVPGDDSAKATDPAFNVPTVANPIPDEVVKDLEIVEDRAAGSYRTRPSAATASKKPIRARGPIGSACPRLTTARRPGRVLPFS